MSGNEICQRLIADHSDTQIDPREQIDILLDHLGPNESLL